MKKILKQAVLTLVVLLMLFTVLFSSTSAYAVAPVSNGTGGTASTGTTSDDSDSTDTGGCPTTGDGTGGCYTQCASGQGGSGCVDCNGSGCVDPAATPNSTCNKDQGCDLVDKYVNPIINTLSILFGLIAAASIIMGGIQFTASEGDPQKAAKAKNRISKTILALFAYAFLYAFLQFIVPGGIFS